MGVRLVVWMAGGEGSLVGLVFSRSWVLGLGSLDWVLGLCFPFLLCFAVVVVFLALL